MLLRNSTTQPVSRDAGTRLRNDVSTVSVLAHDAGEVVAAADDAFVVRRARRLRPHLRLKAHRGRLQPEPSLDDDLESAEASRSGRSLRSRRSRRSDRSHAAGPAVLPRPLVPAVLRSHVPLGPAVPRVPPDQMARPVLAGPRNLQGLRIPPVLPDPGDLSHLLALLHLSHLRDLPARPALVGLPVPRDPASRSLVVNGDDERRRFLPVRFRATP